MYVCIYICIYVRTCVYIHMYTYIHTYIHNNHTYIIIHTYIHTSMHACIHTYIRTHIIHIGININICEAYNTDSFAVVLSTNGAEQTSRRSCLDSSSLSHTSSRWKSRQLRSAARAGFRVDGRPASFQGDPSHVCKDQRYSKPESKSHGMGYLGVVRPQKSKKNSYKA